MRELVAERGSSRRENERAIKLCPKTHRKFKRHNPGPATPIVHPGRRRFTNKIQRRNSAADAPQYILRGRNDGPPDGVPGHGPELPDPRAQGGRLPAGQPDEPAEHPTQQRWPASVIEKTRGSSPWTVVDKSSYLKQKLKSSYSYCRNKQNFTQSSGSLSCSLFFFNYLCKNLNQLNC